MHVRLAGPSDAEAIRVIYNAEVESSTSTFDQVPRSVDEQASWMEEHAGTHPVVVATDQFGVVIGFASLSLYKERPSYATTVEDSVYVAAAHRGMGVGRALLEELMTLASRHGFHTVMARIAGDNRGSIDLHQAFGFATVGIEREVGRKFNRWLDVVIMQRML